MKFIYHITSNAAWEQAQKTGSYRGDTLETEGFIHCSDRHQFLKVANARFRGRTDLVLLTIDSETVKASLKYEAGEVGELFPHVYSPLEITAVVRAVPLCAAANGSFIDPSDAT
jgi:uncharacterized protein (DUF952 family)